MVVCVKLKALLVAATDSKVSVENFILLSKEWMKDRLSDLKEGQKQ